MTSDLAEARKEQLFFYSPYNFIRIFPAAKQLELVHQRISDFHQHENNRIVQVDVNGHAHAFYISFLPWDTDYFKISTYKLNYVLYGHHDPHVLAEAVRLFIDQLFVEKAYCFMEIPSEDLQLIQALGQNKFSLVETRLTYFRGDLHAFEQERYPVRKANEEDKAALAVTAREMRNEFDRFHADPVFSAEAADAFLATYLEQSLKGFADVVLVPAEPGIPTDSFLTANYLKHEWERNGIAIAKMVLSAISSKSNKGWYKKLVSEMTFHLRDAGADYIFMNTQATNRAVIHTWEKLGYRLGCTTHIFSRNNL